MTIGTNRLMQAAWALATGVLATAALAAPPNDDWSTRTAIATLPFSETLAGVEAATSPATDPYIECVRQGDHERGDSSVWYEYATGAVDEFVDVSAAGYDTLIGVFEGSPDAGFVAVRGGCNDDGVRVAGGSRIFGLRLRANTRYSLLVGSYWLNSPPPLTLGFSLRRSAVYSVTNENDAFDGVCDADCSLRDAVGATATVPGAIVLPAGTFAIPGGAAIATGGAWYGAGMDRTIVDAQGVSRTLTLANDTHYDTFALHDLTLANGRALNVDESAGRGGALYSGFEDVIVLDRAAVRGSFAAGSGGGIYAYGTLKLYDSVVAGNLSQASGGGIAAIAWTLDIERSSIVGNEAQATAAQSGGGGLYANMRYGTRLRNTTISGNRAAGEGAALIRTDRTYANIRIGNSSIVDNQVGALADMSQQGGLKVINADSFTLDRPVAIVDTVIAGNRPANEPERLADCALSARVTIATRYNVVQAPQRCAFAGAGDTTGVDPRLEPLAVSIGMPVHGPMTDSPLVDAGDPSGCERTDARGIVRPLDGNGDGVARCDIGAVELLVDRIFDDGFEVR